MTSKSSRFTEIKNILEEAVGDIGIHAHGHFWLERTRDDFVNKPVLGRKLIQINADGTFDDNESNLIKALEGRVPFGRDTGSGGSLRRMPAGRPPVTPEKIAIIRTWIRDGCPDDPLPAEEGPLSFEADIKDLFRETPDRTSMLNIAGFDLHKFEDVRDRADPILEMVENQSMPCDGPWPPEKVEKFRKWINDGKNP